MAKSHFLTCTLQNLPGRVHRRDRDVEIWVLADSFSPLGHGCRVPHERPRQVYFTSRIAVGEVHVFETFWFKKRRLTITSSMKAELAIVMANAAHLRPASLVIDSFCGTGGVIFVWTQWVAVSMASDIHIFEL